MDNSSKYYRQPNFSFNIHNYDSAKNLTAEEWFHQLAARFHIITFLNNEYFQDEIKSDLEKIEEKGIIPYDKKLIDKLKKSFEYDPSRDRSVNFITSDAINKLHVNLSTNKNKSGYKHHSYQKHIIGNTIYISINLFASNKTIELDLKEILRETRSLFAFSKTKKGKCIKKIMECNFSKNEFHKWANYHVLAFIDLRLLAVIHNKKLSQKQIEKILNLDNRSRIYDTLQPLTDYLTSFEFLMKFMHYIVDQNNPSTKNQR